MNKVFLFFALLMCVSLSAQRIQTDGCNIYSEMYKDYKRYIPTKDSPIFTLKLNYIFLQKSDGTGGFSKNNPEHMDIVKRSFKRMNERYSKLIDPKSTVCYKGDDFVPDAHVRFKLNEIIEIKEDSLWNMDLGSLCPNEGKWYLNALDSLLENDPRYVNAINIYFPNSLIEYNKIVVEKRNFSEMSGFSDCSQFPSRKDYKRLSKLNMANEFVHYMGLKHQVVYDSKINPERLSWEEGIYYWYWNTFAQGVTHELGHTLGLSHHNEHHGANKCGASIMNQKHGNPKNYLQPTELGKIHRNLRMTNIRNYLAEEVYSPIPWIIDRSIIVDINYKVYEDIIIKSGDTLTVTCHLEMSPETSIYIEPGAILDLTNGTIGSVENYEWKGIVYLKHVKRRCFLKNKKQLSKQGVIINKDNLSGYISIETRNKRKRS